MRRIFLTCILLAALTACAPLTATSLPLPTPTSEPPTVTASSLPPTPEPSVTETPVPPTQETGPEATYTEPATQTLEPFPTMNAAIVTLSATDLPQPKVDAGAIQMYAPGPMSKVVSPIVVYGYAIPGYDHKGRLDLYGEDGRLIATELIQLNTAIKWAYFNIGFDFEIESVSELGRLSLSTWDEQGRLTAVYSVHLLLMGDGPSIVYPPGNLREHCVIEQPSAGKRASGGVLNVSGIVRPFNSQPLVVELTDPEGNLLGAQIVPVTPAADDSFVPFSVSIPYTITRGMTALLTVSQPDDRIPGTMYLYSQEVLLNP